MRRLNIAPPAPESPKADPAPPVAGAPDQARRFFLRPLSPATLPAPRYQAAVVG